jgi:hypothetical protein
MELIATAYVYAREGRYISARQRFASKTNTFVSGLSTEHCGYLDTLYPHPYLAFVHHGNPPCGIPDINNIGLFGPDFPSRRSTDRFVILLTGGSVAAQFAMPNGAQPAYLESILNSRFVSPNGMPFLVLDGADGAWKQPQQAILALLYADAVHAIVTLDGFNEYLQIDSGRRFEFPANNFLTVNPLASQDFGSLVMRWAVGRLRSRAAANVVLSRSNAAYETIALLERWAERHAAAAATRRTTVDSMFALPAGWTDDDRRTWEIDQYKKYLRVITEVARDHGALSAHFIQPVPAIDKPLTSDEQKVVGELKYGDVYQAMVKQLLTLNDASIPVVSLVSIFKDDRRTLYGDPIHLLRENGRSPGYERMAERIADDLGRLWRLSRR